MLIFDGNSIKILDGRYTEEVKWDVWKFWIKKTKSEKHTYFHLRDGFGNGEWIIDPYFRLFLKVNPPRR